MKLVSTLLVVGLSLALGGQAMADDVEFDMDKLSKVSEQKLLLKGAIKTSLPSNDMIRYVSELGLNRFNTSIATSDPNDPAVGAWCDKAVQDTQVKRDQVDGETGDAEITLKAKLERCSDVFKFDLAVSHKCKRTGKKKDTWSCTVSGKMTVYKYKASQASGALTYTTDKAFEKGGKVVKTASWSSSSKKKAAAISGAVSWAARFMGRELKDIKEFQISAPIIGVKDGNAYTCLARDVVDLDLPFNVIFNGPKGEEHAGFVKARKIYDGCTETPSLKEKAAKGKKK